MVKDLKYILKRILIGVGIALALMFLKGGLIADVNAATTGYILYNSNYGVIAQNSVTTNQNINYQSVYRIRLNFDNSIVQNHTYLATITIDLTRVDNVSPTYPARAVFVGGQEQISESSIVESYVEQQGAVSYYRHLVLNYTFKANNSSSINNFFEAQLSSSAHITYLNANITITDIDDGTSSTVNNAANQIINNNNSNTQNIINNQNQNTDKEIESQKVCKTIDKSNIKTFNYYYDGQGVYRYTSNNNIGVSDKIKVSSSDTLNVLYNVANINYTGALCFFDNFDNVISCPYYPDLSTGDSINIPTGSIYFIATLRKDTNMPQLTLCQNGNQAVNDAISDLDRNITDDTGLSNEEIGGYIDLDYASDTPISDLILMPLTLINKFIDGFSGTCSNYNLGSLLGTSLVLPCIDVEDHVGSSVWSIIDGLCSIFLIYNIGLLFVHMYDTITSLNDGFDELYSPKHADTGYTPKHGGGS